MCSKLMADGEYHDDVNKALRTLLRELNQDAPLRTVDRELLNKWIEVASKSGSWIARAAVPVARAEELAEYEARRKRERAAPEVVADFVERQVKQLLSEGKRDQAQEAVDKALKLFLVEREAELAEARANLSGTGGLSEEHAEALAQIGAEIKAAVERVKRFLPEDAPAELAA